MTSEVCVKRKRRREFPESKTVQDDKIQFVAISNLLIHLGWNWVGIIMSPDDSGKTEGHELRRSCQGKSQAFSSSGAFLEKEVAELGQVCQCQKSAYGGVSVQKIENHFAKDVLVFSQLNKLHHYIRRVNFIDPIGEKIYFNEKGEYVYREESSNPPMIDNRTQMLHIVYHSVLSLLLLQGTSCVPVDSSTIKRHFLCVRLSMVSMTTTCSDNCIPGFRRVLRTGKPACCYNCVRCSEGEISTETDVDICQRCPDTQWPNERGDMCQPKTFEFLSYETDLISSIFSFFSILFSVLTAVVLVIFIVFRDTPIVRANNRNLSFVLLISLCLSFLCVFFFIGRPVDATCMLRHASFGIIFTVAVSSVLAKTIIVGIAFKATKPGNKWQKLTGLKIANNIFISCFLIQVLICVSWLVISPPFQDLNMNSLPGKIIVKCNEGSSLAFYCVIGYIGLLAAMSFIVAYLVRTLPNSFNEGKHLTFSMLVFCCVWACVIPAYLSTQGKDMVSTEIFAILASSAGLLMCIFFPKCYIILLKPHRNTKRHFAGRLTTPGYTSKKERKISNTGTKFASEYANVTTTQLRAVISTHKVDPQSEDNAFQAQHYCIQYSNSGQCILEYSSVHRPDFEYLQDGDIVIGGVLTVLFTCCFFLLNTLIAHQFGAIISSIYSHSTGPDPRDYINLLVFLFAIEHVNMNPNILPNITLGYHLYDSCLDTRKAVKSVLQILSGSEKTVPNYSCMDHNKLAGFIGDHYSATTMPIAEILGLYGYSQISYGATDYSLSDKLVYPHFFRMVQSDYTHFNIVTQLLKHFGWTWVGILTTDDETGGTESQILTSYMAMTTDCYDIGVLMQEVCTGQRVNTGLGQLTSHRLVNRPYRIGLLHLSIRLNSNLWIRLNSNLWIRLNSMDTPCPKFAETRKVRHVQPETRKYYEDFEYLQDGDIVIGGVLTVNNALYLIWQYNKNAVWVCENPGSELCWAVLCAVGVSFVTEHVNMDPNILPNITLGYHFYDSCFYARKAVKSVLQILSGPEKTVPNYSCMAHNKLAGFIGDHYSATTIPIADMLGVYGYSQISYGATDYSLSDRLVYPHFFRMVENDYTYCKIVTQLLKYFGWTWVGIVFTFDETGDTESQILTKYMARNAAEQHVPPGLHVRLSSILGFKLSAHRM
ncbi:vomeronasal type-2 receptor 26-like [Pelobates cultripes]|uniref:Vomeronasal type-2 receptor 26-like n=1 Tax=Pelobates cultripes TaxID=61616 RepID=A0AAD1SDC3_PELCU|nr:vomeronasal type-2 receptor 26-like [Pelobates cultripes]